MFVVGAILEQLMTLWNQIIFAISGIRFFDILDIIVIAVLVYKGIEFLRENRAGQLFKGIIILLIAYFFANWFELVMLRWLLSVIVDSALILLVIVFQPEIRRLLERIGRTRISRGNMMDEDIEQLSQCIDNISKAAGMMQESKTGALVVFERQTQLGEIINTGTIVDAVASVSMTNNIFFPKSPLHDGALIVRGGRLYAAGCILPLTQRSELSATLGTRHRAGIGMTENSDAVVLIVSEETGIISIVCDGQIKRNYNAVSAGAELKRLIIDSQFEKQDMSVVNALKRFNPFKKHDDKKEKGDK
ncbi:MAG: TIGR00159 family protein [Ruminococcaceae bacterium]|nr:TIGR00159 family protein [Oscillospiraceae bacterium]